MSSSRTGDDRNHITDLSLNTAQFITREVQGCLSHSNQGHLSTITVESESPVSCVNHLLYELSRRSHNQDKSHHWLMSQSWNLWLDLSHRRQRRRRGYFRSNKLLVSALTPSYIWPYAKSEVIEPTWQRVPDGSEIATWRWAVSLIQQFAGFVLFGSGVIIAHVGLLSSDGLVSSRGNCHSAQPSAPSLLLLGFRAQTLSVLRWVTELSRYF